MSILGKFKITKKVFQNGDFYIFGASPIAPYSEELKLNKYFSITLKGDLSYLSENKEYELEIEELSTDTYGTSYKVISCPSICCEDLEHLTREESLEILKEITTDSQANNLLDAYDNFIWLALSDRNQIDVKNIYNVGEYRLNAYIRDLTVKYKYLGIMNKLKDWKVDISDCKNLLDFYNEEKEIIKAFTENPYSVNIDILKRSFEYSDKLIMEYRNDLEKSEVRCAYLILSVLQRNEMDGDSKLDANCLYNYILEEYPIARELEPFIVPTVTTNELFHYDEEEQTVASMTTYLAECKIANFIKDKVENSTKLDFEWDKYKEVRDGVLTEEQQNILKTFCESNIVIVDSKGGTGKSASTKALLDMLDDYGMTYSLLAPTGRVAKVLKELTNRPTSTIHKAVLKNAEDGIWSDVFIIEEGSMIGIDLMCMLINAISNPNARIVVNMDLGQIAPISCGCPMRDIINSGIAPICKLTKVFRYGEGGLYKMATDAYDKKFYIPTEISNGETDRISVGKNKDYTCVRYNGTVEQIINEYKNFISKGYKPQDIAVITPWNVTEFGTINLNNKIQEIVNPRNTENVVEKTIRKHKVKFKIGDQILNTKNNYNVLTLEGYNALKTDSMLTKEDVPTSMCMNGEIGKITDIDGGNIIAQFDEEILVFDKGMQSDLLLGYSLTSYKLQGSSVPYVITLVTPEFQKSLDKNIIYTDMSRTKKEIVEIVDPTTLANAICIDSIQERQTNLLKLLLQ